MQATNSNFIRTYHKQRRPVREGVEKTTTVFEDPSTYHLVKRILVLGGDFNSPLIHRKWGEVAKSDEVWQSIADKLGLPELYAEKGLLFLAVRKCCRAYLTTINDHRAAGEDVKNVVKGQLNVEKMLKLTRWKAIQDRYNLIAILSSPPTQSPDQFLCHSLEGMLEQEREVSQWYEYCVKPLLDRFERAYLFSLQLSTLSAEIGQLKSLACLDLKDNQLCTLPKEIWHLSALTELDLSQNKFTALPTGIEKLKGLTWLNLEKNRLNSLPGISQLTNLSYLNLSRNGLNALPPGIGQLSKLRRLKLHRNNFARISAEIGRLEALENVSFAYNPLITVPSGMERLTVLRSIELDLFQYSIFKEEIRRFHVRMPQVKQVTKADGTSLTYLIGFVKVYISQEHRG